jgi:hypothetical protein
MTPDDPLPSDPDDDAESLMREELGLDNLSPSRREALLRRILQRTGGVPPLAPAPPPKAPPRRG